MVIPYVDEGEQVQNVLKNDDVMLAVSLIKEQFSLIPFPTIDFKTEYDRLQNRSLAASALNAKSDGLQELVMNSRADIYVTVKLSFDKIASGASIVTAILEAKERETGFSLANASIVSDPFKATDKELVQYALSPTETLTNFMNQVGMAFDDMVANGREVNLVISVNENCEFDMVGDLVGSTDKTLEEEVTDWVTDNAVNGNGEVRAGGSRMEVFMKVPVYDPNTGRPFLINRMGAQFLRALKGWLEPAGFKVTREASSGQYIQYSIQ
jgi:hypothetical protein